MIDAFSTGIELLSLILGFNRFGNYTVTQNDLTVINQYLQNNNIVVQQMDSVDVYSCEGENKYVYFKINETYSLLFDKKEKEILEFSNNIQELNEDDFAIYIPNNGSDYVAVLDGDEHFYMNDSLVTNDMIIANSNPYNFDEIWERFDEYGQNTTFAHHYYFLEHLGNFHGYNSSDECAVVATQILLSYYDSLRNDNIVPEEYDVMFSGNSEYFDNYHPTFEMNNDLLHEEFKNNLKDYCIDNSINSLGTSLTASDVYELVDGYVGSRNVLHNTFCVSGTYSEIINNTCALKIQSIITVGRPVIVGTCHHAAVAYAFDDDYVYVHAGGLSVRRIRWCNFITSINNDNNHPGLVDLYVNSHSHSDNFLNTSLNKYICICGAHYDHISSEPEDYRFSGAYNNSPITKTVTIQNEYITTKRLRAALIEEDQINLSARKNDAGLAYLEIHTPYALKKVKMQLALWGKHEYLDPIDSSVLVQYKDPDNDDWYTICNLISDYDLKTNHLNKKLYTFSMPETTYAVRIWITTSQVGTWNKGRLSIGNIYYEKTI